MAHTALGSLALATTRPQPEAAPAASPHYAIGAYTRPWDQYDYRVALDGIAEAGYQHAGLMTAKGRSWVILTTESTPDEVAAIHHEVQQRSLKLLSIYAGEFPVAHSVADGIRGLRTLIDHCAACQCPDLMLAGTAEPTFVRPYYQVVAECCAYAATQHVRLSLKPHGGTNATGPQCRQLLERVGHPNFRIWYDPGNICYYSDGRLDPVEDCAAVDGLVVGMSVKDFKPPKEVLLNPGTGQVRFPQVLTRLRQGGFAAGPLLVECLARGPSPTAVTAAAKQTRLWLEKLIQDTR